MQTENMNGSGAKRFLSPEDTEKLAGDALEIQMLTQRFEELRAQLAVADHGTLQDLMDGTKPDQPIIDEIKKVDARIKELTSDVSRLGILLTADKALDQWVRPYVALAGQVAPAAAHELAGICAILIDAAVTVAVDLRPQRQRNMQDTAWSRKAKLDAYVAEGFSRSESFAMVLAEIKPPDYAALTQSVKEVDTSKVATAVHTLKKDGPNGNGQSAD